MIEPVKIYKVREAELHMMGEAVAVRWNMKRDLKELTLAIEYLKQLEAEPCS